LRRLHTVTIWKRKDKKHWLKFHTVFNETFVKIEWDIWTQSL
jgi:hypothetical protein